MNGEKSILSLLMRGFSRKQTDEQGGSRGELTPLMYIQALAFITNVCSLYWGMFSLLTMYFSCSWRMMKVASVVPSPGRKPNCIKSMSTISPTKVSVSWSISLSPWIATVKSITFTLVELQNEMFLVVENLITTEDCLSHWPSCLSNSMPSSPTAFNISASFFRGDPTLTAFFFFFSWWGEGWSKYHYKRAITGPPAKCHWMAFHWQDDDCPTLNAGVVALWFLVDRY